jgi:hypothetical protein
MAAMNSQQGIRVHTFLPIMCALGAVIAAGRAGAAPPPETSLNTCQNAVKTATKASSPTR